MSIVRTNIRMLELTRWRKMWENGFSTVNPNVKGGVVKANYRLQREIMDSEVEEKLRRLLNASKII